MRRKKTNRRPRKSTGAAVKPTLFEVHGPVPIKPSRGPGGRLIDESSVGSFWKQKDASRLKEYRGCYVFAIRSGKGGLQPWYIGKTKRSFEAECFNSRNITKYNRATLHYKACTPLLFFIVVPKKRGAVNRKQIGELEVFLIRESTKVNRRILNKTNINPRKWEIPGVTRRTQGKPRKPAQSLAKMLEL